MFSQEYLKLAHNALRILTINKLCKSNVQDRPEMVATYHQMVTNFQSPTLLRSPMEGSDSMRVLCIAASKG